MFYSIELIICNDSNLLTVIDSFSCHIIKQIFISYRVAVCWPGKTTISHRGADRPDISAASNMSSGSTSSTSHHHRFSVEGVSKARTSSRHVMRNSSFKKMSAKARAFCIDNLLSDITVVTSPVTAAENQISTAESQNLSNSNSTREVSVLLALMSAR